MDWNTVFSLIPPQLFIVIVACWILGTILKVTPRIPNWSIVYIVAVVAIVFSCLLLGSTPLNVLYGFLCGAVAVLGHQLLKQGKEGAVGG